MRRYLWTDFQQVWNIASLYLTGENSFLAVRSEVVYAHARPLIDCHVLPSKFAEAINVVFAK